MGRGSNAKLARNSTMVRTDKPTDRLSGRPTKRLVRDKKNFTLQGKPWHICASNALTGEGLTEGIEWLTDQLKDIIAQ